MHARPNLTYKVRGTVLASLFGVIGMVLWSIVFNVINSGFDTQNIGAFMSISVIFLLFGIPVALIIGAIASLIIWPIIDRIPAHPRLSCPVAGGILGALLTLPFLKGGGMNNPIGFAIFLIGFIAICTVSGHIAYRSAKEKDADISGIF